MNPIARNILAVITGIAVGMSVNMGTLYAMMAIVPLPEGMIPGDVESLQQHIGDFTFMNFMSPFLAHALGTLAGAFTVVKIAANNKQTFGLAMGVFFLLGGVAMVFEVDAPTWFDVMDLTLAYIPMGWLGYKLAGNN